MATPTKHVVLFSGFTQSERKYNGIADLSTSMRELADCRKVWIHTPPFVWHKDEDSVGAYLASIGAREVMIVGYSWGGNKAVILAEDLRDRGIKVPYLILCDPVKRPAPISYLGKFAFFRKRVKFLLPENVARAAVFTQDTKWPYGFGVDPVLSTSVEEEHVQKVPHELMDSYSPFHEKALKWLKLFEGE